MRYRALWWVPTGVGAWLGTAGLTVAGLGVLDRSFDTTAALVTGLVLVSSGWYLVSRATLERKGTGVGGDLLRGPNGLRCVATWAFLISLILLPLLLLAYWCRWDRALLYIGGAEVTLGVLTLPAGACYVVWVLSDRLQRRPAARSVSGGKSEG